MIYTTLKRRDGWEKTSEFLGPYLCRNEVRVAEFPYGISCLVDEDAEPVDKAITRTFKFIRVESFGDFRFIIYEEI